MADEDDPTEAALRLEAALERIAQASLRPQSEHPGHNTAQIAARLDALIAQLRAALGVVAGP